MMTNQAAFINAYFQTAQIFPLFYISVLSNGT